MNALVITRVPDGVDIELKTDDTQPDAARFAQWLYDQIMQAEKNCPEPETP